MISGVADHCFWFGRYIERAEATARLLQTTHNLALDAELTAPQCWLPVVIVAGEQERFLSLHGQGASSDGEAVQQYMCFEEANPVSLSQTVYAARENARSIREVLSLEIWETVNELHLWLATAEAREAWGNNRFGFYQSVEATCQRVLGQLETTMLQDLALSFVRLGLCLERASQSARILDVQFHAFEKLHNRHDVIETSLWLSLLRACAAFEPFMKRHRGAVSGEPVARFLIGEPLLPRSLRCSVNEALHWLSTIRPDDAGDSPGERSLKRLTALDGWLAARDNATLDAAAVHECLTYVVDEVHGACADIGEEFLGYKALPVGVI